MNNIYDDINDELENLREQKLNLTVRNLELQQELNKMLDILPINIQQINDTPIVLNTIDDVARFLQTIIDLELG